MHIYVKTLFFKNIPIEITALDTIGDVKSKIYDSQGIPVEEQILTFKGNELDDEQTLNDIGVQNAAVFCLIIKCFGN